MEDRNNNNSNNYNPNLPRNSRPLDFRDSTNSWIIAAVLAVAFIVGILFFNHNTRIASQQVSPVAVPDAPAATPVP